MVGSRFPIKTIGSWCSKVLMIGNPILLSLPRNDGFGDVLRRLAEAVNLVAAIEERPPAIILAEAQSCEFTSVNTDQL
jgi:hypothetical protein